MSTHERINRRWTVGEWEFQEVEILWGSHEWRTFYRFTAEGLAPNNELYDTLEHAMAEAIGSKYTGPRGAGGSGVNTAAGWFLRMIGADAYPNMTAAEVAAKQEGERLAERQRRLDAEADRRVAARKTVRGTDKVLG